MKMITREGVGVATHNASIRDSHGTGLLPLQARITGTATFKISGRVSAEAPWVELRAANTVPFLESISWVPYIQLEITSGTGTVDLWVGER